MKDILLTECFIKFLEIDRYSPNINYNSPKKIIILENLPLGIRDSFYFQEERCMLRNEYNL
jgi:hypothetical protein